MRLLLSLAVIIGHTPELLDGNRHREPLTWLFHNVSLGETAVFGFFVLSGYLLTASIISAPDLAGYATKRIARIYPGFLLSTLFCIVVVAPLAGGILLPNYVSRSLMLLPPASEGAFAGAPYPWLNGALWTIHHEACCYVVLAALSVCRLLRRPRAMVALTVVTLLVAYLSGRIDGEFRSTHPDLLHFPHLLSAFLVGSCAKIGIAPSRWTGRAALLSVTLLALALGLDILPEQAVILFGGYVLLWFCERRATPVIGQIGRRTDLSYGIYLYAWPVQNILIWRYGFHNLAAISLTTIAIVFCAAFVSWHVVERPAMKLALALIGVRSRGRSGGLSAKTS